MLRNKIRRYLKHGTLRQLSVFEAVARLGSFTRAAEELHMAQPTVSVQMKKLTENIGMPIFEQKGRTFRLTEAGHALEDACQGLFSVLSRLDDELSEIRERRAVPALSDEYEKHALLGAVIE
ncbi:MAG: transcriptional regulator [Betaproteobacteria bacterium]|nr:transcriptional regulator [Betaproteobacteria bacterium]